METRELFERLIADEPPLRLSPALVLRDGRRAATRRWAGAAAGAVAVVVVSSGLVVRTAGHHRSAGVAEPTQTPTSAPGPVGTPAPALASGLPGSFDAATLPFLSLAQVQEVVQQEYQTMTPAEGALLVGNGTGGGVGGSGSRSASKVVETFRQYGPSPAAVLQLTVASPNDARREYGAALTKGPCAGPIPKRSAASDCVSALLPGGGTLWSWQVAQAHPSTGVLQRSALIVAADGSALEVLEWAEGAHGGARIPLPSHHVLDEKSLISLAEQATVTWVSASRSFTAEAAGTVPTGAGPSLGGPGIAALPFRSVAQITASNAAVYAKLVAAAGGKAALIRGWPTLQSGRISAKSPYVRTEVQWPMGKNSAYLDVVTSTAAEAKSWYGPALTSGACVNARGQAGGAPVRCAASPLPGGARAWVWENKSVVGPPPRGPAKGALPRATVGRAVLVVAKDGSTLALTEFALTSHVPGTGSPAAVSRSIPDRAALLRLAAELAQAWEAAAG